MNFLSILLMVVCFEFSAAAYLPALRQDTRCPNGWTPFKDEKCILIVAKAGLQAQEDAEIICQTFSNQSSQDVAKLLTVKSYEEQEFVHNFLFVENKVIDHVWLGLKETWKSGVFEWNDGSETYFTNWADQNITDDHHKCVQIESGEGNDPPGIWIRVNCQKRNTIVCEKMQSWSFERLQATILTLKLQLQNTIIEQTKTEKELSTFKQVAEKDIQSLKNDSGIPVGFIYVQLSGQTEPSTMWPFSTWKDVSSSYAGLFFRVAGGNASQFGRTQAESSSRLANVEWKQGSATTSSPAVSVIPSDGSWSSYVYTGTSYSSPYMGVRFQLSGGEVRPKNQAVKIWVKTK